MTPSLNVFSILFYACVVQTCLGATVRSKNTICTTESCRKAAKFMLDNMDKTASPCVDFNKYACGNYMKKFEKYVGLYSTGGAMVYWDNNFKRDLLESPINDNRADSFEAKMKMLYKSCMDLDAMEMRGLEDYKEDYKDHWPTLNPKWTEASFDLQSLNIDYSKIFKDVLFRISLKIDATGQKEGTYLIEFNQPGFLLSTQQLQGPRDSESLLAYEKYYVDIAMALNGDRFTAEYDAKRVVDFLRHISEYYGDVALRENPRFTRHPSTLGEMNHDYPYLDWVKLIQVKYDETDIKIKPDQRVNVVYPKFFKGLETVLKSTDGRVIQNLFGFKKAIGIIRDATNQTRHIWEEFSKTFNSSRWPTCVANVDFMYNYGMAKLMSYSRFSNKSKEIMDTMILNIKDAYIESLENQDWLSESTKREAIKKVKNLKSKVAIPSENFEEDDLDTYYKNYKVSGKLYIKDYAQNLKQKTIQRIKQLNKPEDWRWDNAVTSVNAFHLYAQVEIMFCLGYFQPPMFNQNAPGYLNYGSMGPVIAHEIGHGFDTIGRQYDAEGHVRDWLTPKDSKNFEKKANCYIDQYSNFFEPQINMSINGKQTIDENTADNIGVLQIHKAYMKYASEHPEELPLPDLDLTKEQLFFLIGAQMWCFKASDDYLKGHLQSRYPPYGFRTIGMMQNSKAFAKAFNCKKGDYMNPEKKCKLF